MVDFTLPFTPPAARDFTDPRERALLAHFRDTLGWGWNLHARATFAFLMDARRFCAGGTLLDAGAGHRRFEPFFDAAARYLALEHPAGIALKGMEQVPYDIIAPLDGGAFVPAGSVDAIYCHSVLEHVARPERFFANCRDALRPGGRLYLHVPFMYLEHEIPHDYNRFTRYGLKSRLEEAGLAIHTLIPGSNAFYGASNFLGEGLRQDRRARRLAGEPVNLLQATWLDFAVGALRRMTDRTSAIFDEVIRDNTSPVGWLCIAECPVTASRA